MFSPYLFSSLFCDPNMLILKHNHGYDDVLLGLPKDKPLAFPQGMDRVASELKAVIIRINP